MSLDHLGPHKAPDAGESERRQGNGPDIPEKTQRAASAEDQREDQREVTSNVDLEQLERQPASGSTGPAYSVFSKATKRWVILMATLGGVVSPMTANIYFPALNPIAADLGVSIGLINLTLTTYMVFQAIGPAIFGDFGDVAGRRPAYLLAFSIYLLANIGLAVQNNYAALLVLRMVQSLGSAGTLALGFAVVADVSVSAERGKYMGILNGGINVGLAASPAIGGALSQYLGWRAIFWFCAIFIGAWLIPYALAVPETCRKVVGNGSIPAQGWNKTLLEYARIRRHRRRHRQKQSQSNGNDDEDEDDSGDTANLTKPTSWRVALPNPLHMLAIILEKELGLLILYNTTFYLVIIILMATLSTLFKEIYHYPDSLIGLCYLPYGLGCCVAALAQGYLLDWNYRRLARRAGLTIDYRRGDDLSKFPIEAARIQPLWPLTAAGVAACVGYGWALEVEAHVAVPLVLGFLIGACLAGSFSILSTLLVDLCPEAPATAVAAMNFVRCIVGAGMAAAIESMLKTMGRGWCFTFLGGLVAVFSPTLWVVSRWGPRWREERRVRGLRKKEKEEKKLEQRSG